MSTTLRSARNVAAILLAGVALAMNFASATPAAAHGFTSVVFVDATAPDDTHVRTHVGLEYDLLVVSAAENQHDPSFFEYGMELFQTGDELLALQAHPDTVFDYLTGRLVVSAGGQVCTPVRVGDYTVEEREGVPYAFLDVDHTCSSDTGGGHEIRSALFPDSEGYVRDTKTIVTFDLGGDSGSAALDAANPSFTTQGHWGDSIREFFLLGAEHLYGGLDHILFLLAIIIGSRRLRDVVLAATTFTIAHSVTFLLAALGLVEVPGAVVEPIIALSIAVVAAWYLWGLGRAPTARPRGDTPISAADRPATENASRGTASGTTALAERPLVADAQRWGLDRRDRMRLMVVFAFGLIHGLGFAGALGIDEAWSWTLLWSLLVFNVGIEAVQLGMIVILFPALLMLRRHLPRTGLWVGIVIATGVTCMGLIWFVQRVFGLV